MNCLWGVWVRQRCCVSYITGGVQLRLAYNWARPAILAAGKGECFYFFCFFTFCFFTFISVSSLSFILLFLPCPSLSSPLLLLSSLFSLSLGDNTKWPTRADVSLNPNTIKWTVLYSGSRVSTGNNGFVQKLGQEWLKVNIIWILWVKTAWKLFAQTFGGVGVGHQVLSSSVGKKALQW